MCVRRKGSLKGNSFDVLQDEIQSLTICTPKFPFVIREPLKYVLGCVDALIFPNPYPQPVEVGGSKGRYNALHTIVTVSRPSVFLGHSVGLVKERVADDHQTLGRVGSLAEDLLYRRTRHVHQGFCDK